MSQLTGLIANALEFTDRSVDDSRQCLLRRDDTSTEACVFFAETTNLIERDVDFLFPLTAYVTKRRGI